MNPKFLIMRMARIFDNRNETFTLYKVKDCQGQEKKVNAGRVV